MEYTITSSESLSDLKKQVNTLIQRGWIPQGGLATVIPGFYAQAMIKQTI